MDPGTDDATAEAPEIGGGRERVMRAAYDLFSQHGVRAVGIDTIIERAGVAKMTLYRHFASKDELVMAFLARREQLWTQAWLQEETQRRGTAPAQRLLAIFDVFSEWFEKAKFEGCSFLNVMTEISDRESQVRQASVRHLANIRSFLRELAAEAGVEDPDAFARQWHILMKGSIMAAGEGDVKAARRARQLGELLLAHHGIEA